MLRNVLGEAAGRALQGANSETNYLCSYYMAD